MASTLARTNVTDIYRDAVHTLATDGKPTIKERDRFELACESLNKTADDVSLDVQVIREAEQYRRQEVAASTHARRLETSRPELFANSS